MIALKVGDPVFFRHPEHSWVCGLVEDVENQGVIVCITKDEVRKEVPRNETIRIKKPEDIEPLHNDAFDENSNDLLTLTVLHEAALLRCLYVRYMKDIIYTNIGSIVVALNPFTFAIPWYQDEEMTKYLHAGRNLSGSNFPPNLLPHSWAQSHVTYYEMIDTARNQCIIVSGESGSGKTEASKIVLKYLGIVSSLSGTEEEKRSALEVGEKLVACSPILESFGNAKTVRNNNSSRFGKFMKVKFNAKHLVVGAETLKYLLEKSRVISAAKGERVYHSFYLLVQSRGSMARSLGLEDVKKYLSLCSGGTLNNTEYNTDGEFDNVCSAMQNVGMTEDEIASVWRIPAAVMMLLNVQFVPEGDGCSIESSTLHYLKKAAELLQIDENRLIHEFLTSTRTLPGNQVVVKANSLVMAVDVRDAMCKHLYDGVFNWLVERCNDLCNVESDGNWIGLLDIFGFEDFMVNSFEQLCINLTNEYLQHHYNSHIFKRDMDECKEEGVDMTSVTFLDNTGCLRMLTAQGGIFPLLDECCWLGGGTDIGFLEKVVTAHETNAFFKKERVSRDTFCVRHYATDVTYNVTGWIEKNRDTLKDPIKVLARESKDPIVARCLPAPIPLSKKKGGGMDFTAGGLFRNQLTALMGLIESANPHWIRCIKPNPANKPKMFYGRQIMDQLESSGVLGTVKIRKAGYPVRIQRGAFCKKYLMCTSLNGLDEQKLIEDVLKRANLRLPTQVQIGCTKVFLKAEAYDLLERFRNQHLVQTSIALQRISRGYLARQALFATFMLLHEAELLQKKFSRVLINLLDTETDLRESCETEEDNLRHLLSAFEEEQRLLQEEKDAAEKRRREAEEEECRRAKEEERRLTEKKRRIEEIHKRAATCIQSHVRGVLLRNKLYRQLLEERRASLEHECEIACEKERIRVQNADTVRMADEKSWTQWLNSVDHVKRRRQEEEKRLLEKMLQRRRILIRELMRKEDQWRLKLEVEEKEAHLALISRFQSLTAHILKAEVGRQRRVEQLYEARVERVQPEFAGLNARRERSAASDARIKDVLTEYALSRVRFFDEKREKRHGISAEGSHSSKTVKEDVMFNKVREKWLRQREWLNDEPVVGTPQGASRASAMPSSDDDPLNGPHRTVEASFESLSARLNFRSQSMHLATSEGKGYDVMETECTPCETYPRKGKVSIDWNKVFSS